MTSLPSIPDLIRRTKALAALDLILSPEWLYRYYSFNSAWAPGQQMASMRDGCGDEWWLVFDSTGWAALKGQAHESEARSKGREELSRAIQALIPPELTGFAAEPAFRWNQTGFAYFQRAFSQPWNRVNDLSKFAALNSGESELLRHLSGSPEDYASFATDYYETQVPVEIVAGVFGHEPLTENVVKTLNPSIAIEDIASELYTEIGYPK